MSRDLSAFHLLYTLFSVFLSLFPSSLEKKPNLTPSLRLGSSDLIQALKAQILPQMDLPRRILIEEVVSFPSGSS